MNFFCKRPKSREIDFMQTTKYLPKTETLDLPHSQKVTPVLLNLPFPSKSSSSALRPHSRSWKSSKPGSRGKLTTMADINNESLYSNPSFSFSSTPNTSTVSSSSSSKLLPHRFTVECNPYSQMRSRQKSRPRLRKLVIKLI